VVRRPEDSRAQLSSALIRTPTFTPDKPGLYRFTLRSSRMGAMSITNVDLVALGGRQRSVRH
jgi:hypothetical protein